MLRMNLERDEVAHIMVSERKEESLGNCSQQLMSFLEV